MKTLVERETNFIPIKVVITLQSMYELDDLIVRLKADNHLPCSVTNLISTLENYRATLPKES